MVNSTDNAETKIQIPTKHIFGTNDTDSSSGSGHGDNGLSMSNDDPVVNCSGR